MENQPIVTPTAPPPASAVPTPNMGIGQPLPPAAPPPSSKRPLILALVLIILAAAAIAVFYLLNQPVPPAPPVVGPVLPQPTTAPLPTALPTGPAPIEDDLQSLDVTNDLTNEFADINTDLQQL